MSGLIVQGFADLCPGVVSVARHTAYNVVSAVLPIGVTLVTVPLYLQAIGLERYGILALVWVLAGYFNFFDFGIGNATARRMATLSGTSADMRNRLFWTSAAITAALAIAAGLAFWPVATLFIDRTNLPATLRPELEDALWLLIAAVPVGVIQSLLGGALVGRRAFGTLNVIAVVGNLLTAVMPLATAWIFGPRLDLLIAATLASRGLVLLAQFVACATLVPLTAPALETKEAVRGLLAFGGWTTVTGIVGPLLVYFDRFAIGTWIGATAVGFYVFGYNLISQMQVIPVAFCRAIFPRLAELPPDESLGRSVDALWVMTALVTPMAVVAIFMMTPFLHIWLGAEVSVTTGPVAIILLTGFWTNALASVALAQLQATGHPDKVAKIHVGEVIPYAVMLFAGLHFAGLPGAAIAWSVRCAGDFVMLASLANLLSQAKRVLAIGTILVLSAAATAYNISNPALYWSLTIALTSAALWWSWGVMPLHLRAQLRQILRHSLKKAKVRR